MNNIRAGSINTESYHSLINDGDDDLFEAPIDNSDDNNLDNTCDDGDEVHDEGLVSERKNLPYLHNEYEPY